MAKAAAHNPEEAFTLKEKILYTIGGILLLGGSVILGRRLVLKSRANREEKKSFEQGSPATFAKQIRMAFQNDYWPGTDEEGLRRALLAIPSKAVFDQVVSSYKRLYNRNLVQDMSDELQASEYSEMLSILAAKPDKTGGQLPPPAKRYEEWAKRLKAAFDISYGFFPGTDEQAIKAVFNEIPSQAAFVEVGKAYWKLYSSDLTKDLKSELEFWEYGDYMKIITSKPKS